MTVEQLIKSIADLYANCIKKALNEAEKNISNDTSNLSTRMNNAAWSAYCEGLEQALMIIDECTAAGLKQLAERKVKAEGFRSLQDRIDVEGPDMNAAYPKPKVR